MPTDPPPPVRQYWEDLPVGRVLALGSVTVEREEALAFAGRYDPQPFHLDDEAAARSMFGQLATSGWHTCSMAMGLMVRNFLLESSSLGSPGLEKLQWLKPVFPGDTLSLRQRVVETRPMKSRPDVGLVRTQWEMFNQRGEQVLMMDGYGMFRRRTPAAG